MTSSYNQNAALQEQNVRAAWVREPSPYARMYAVSRVWVNESLRLPLTRELFETHFTDDDRDAIRKVLSDQGPPNYVNGLLYQGYADLYEYFMDQGILINDITEFVWLGRHPIDCVNRILDKYESKVDDAQHGILARRFVFCGSVIYRNPTVMKDLFDKELGNPGDVQKTLDRALVDVAGHMIPEDYDTVSWLIEKGANVNLGVETKRYSTPLFVAARNGDLEGIDFLLSKGARVTSELVEAFDQYCSEKDLSQHEAHLGVDQRLRDALGKIESDTPNEDENSSFRP